MSDTTRVNMIWPKDLKDRVNDKAGPRGLTEFTLTAVDTHLKGGADELARLEDELNQVKHLTQLLADRIVMGGSNVDRLEAFMELELPSWLDTSGWPSEMAKRVPSEMPELSSEGIREQVEIPPAVIDTPGPVDAEEAFVEPEPAPVRVPAAPSGEELPEDFFEKKMGGSDLFAKVMEKTGGDPLMSHIKPASEIPKPEPVAQKDLCPTCGDELVDGECWTCG